jgi:hypothetical protein
MYCIILLSTSNDSQLKDKFCWNAQHFCSANLLYKLHFRFKILYTIKLLIVLNYTHTSVQKVVLCIYIPFKENFGRLSRFRKFSAYCKSIRIRIRIRRVTILICTVCRCACMPRATSFTSPAHQGGANPALSRHCQPTAFQIQVHTLLS